jgi:hypothetical protein
VRSKIKPWIDEASSLHDPLALKFAFEAKEKLRPKFAEFNSFFVRAYCLFCFGTKVFSREFEACCGVAFNSISIFSRDRGGGGENENIELKNKRKCIARETRRAHLLFMTKRLLLYFKNVQNLTKKNQLKVLSWVR